MEGTVRGGYAGHGETYIEHNNILWWSHGGEIHGESPKRIKFLHNILKDIPGYGLMPNPSKMWDEVSAILDETAPSGKYFLYYYGFNRPSFRDFYFDDTTEYIVDVIDTWDMTIKNAGTFKGKFSIKLPGKEYMAIRVTKI